MNEKERAAWEKTKARGQRRYVLTNAAAFALPFGLVTLLYQLYRRNKGQDRVSATEIAGVILLVVILSGLIHALRAIRDWRKNEKKYLS